MGISLAGIRFSDLICAYAMGWIPRLIKTGRPVDKNLICFPQLCHNPCRHGNGSGGEICFWIFQVFFSLSMSWSIIREVPCQVCRIDISIFI